LCLTLDEHFESSVEESANQVRFHLCRFVGLLTRLEGLEQDHVTSERLIAQLTPDERADLWKRARAADPMVTLITTSLAIANIMAQSDEEITKATLAEVKRLGEHVPKPMGHGGQSRALRKSDQE
jgi:hypothetical protein